MPLITKLLGVRVLEQTVFNDPRGCFVKTFQKCVFDDLQLNNDFEEYFYTKSTKNVIRGLHFQAPPYDHAKLVSVITGTILDVVLDIRLNSPTYNQYQTFELSAENHKSIYIPSGFAHGFCTLGEEATVSYLTTSEHSSNHDKGIRYDSFGFDWPIKDPILSARDLLLPVFNEFKTPFVGEDWL